MLEQSASLLEKDWSQKERELIKSIIDNLFYYKNLIPNNFKKDISDILDLANKIKTDYDTAILKINNLNSINSEKLDSNDPKCVKSTQTEPQFKSYTIVSRIIVDNNSSIIINSDACIVENTPVEIPTVIPVEIPTVIPAVIPTLKPRRRGLGSFFCIG